MNPGWNVDAFGKDLVQALDKSMDTRVPVAPHPELRKEAMKVKGQTLFFHGGILTGKQLAKFRRAARRQKRAEITPRPPAVHGDKTYRGYMPSLGIYIDSRTQYHQELKRRGLRCLWE